jgi:hypothetical protein
MKPRQADRVMRFEPEKVRYNLWLAHEFPVALADQRRSWRNPAEIPWIWGLLDDLERTGRFLNPLLIWNHHDSPFLPRFCVRHGGNRVWCANRLGWTHVPAMVSTRPSDRDVTKTMQDMGAELIRPEDSQSYFPDGGTVWINDYGYGLYEPKLPEVTYADYRSPAQAETPDAPRKARPR